MKGTKWVYGILGGVFAGNGLAFIVVSLVVRGIENRDQLQYITGAAQPAMPDLWMMFLAMGSIFFLMGSSFLFVLIRQALRRRWLKMNGTCVTAQVTSVEQNFFVRLNGRHPYVIRAVCVHPYTGQEMKVKSAFFMRDPSPYIQNGQIEVMVDPMRENRYHMLTEELL